MTHTSNLFQAYFNCPCTVHPPLAGQIGDILFTFHVFNSTATYAADGYEGIPFKLVHVMF